MKLVALSACTSGQFSQSQLCPHSYTVCNDTGLGASGNITYLCLCQSGYLVTGNISSQYFYSELCAAPTSPPSNSTSASPALGIVSITTAPDAEFQTVAIVLFAVTIGLGLVAIGVIALNIILMLKTPLIVISGANGEGHNKNKLSNVQAAVAKDYTSAAEAAPEAVEVDVHFALA